MKKNLVVSVSLVFLFYSCGHRSATEVKDTLPQWELLGDDTINKIDANGFKQGHWISYEVGPANINVSVTHSADSSQNNASWQSVSSPKNSTV